MGHLYDEFVPSGVTVSVIDALEVVKIYHHDCPPATVARDFRARLSEVVLEQGPIGESGERIVQCPV
jgi:hypothetical protein